MSNYLEIRNDDDVIQINDSAAPLCVLNSGTLYSKFKQEWKVTVMFDDLYGSVGGTMYVCSLPIVENCEYFFSVSSDAYAVFMNTGAAYSYVQRDDGYYEHRTSGPEMMISVGRAYDFYPDLYRPVSNFGKDSLKQIRWYLVGRTDRKNSRGGLQIFDENSEILFNSYWPPIAIEQIYSERNIDTTDAAQIPIQQYYRGMDETPREFDHQIAFSAPVNFFGGSLGYNDFSISDKTLLYENMRFPLYFLTSNTVQARAVRHLLGFNSDTTWNGKPIGYHNGLPVNFPDYLTPAAHSRIGNSTTQIVINASKIDSLYKKSY